MQVTVTEVSDVKVGQYGPSSKMKVSTGDSYFVNEDATPLIGKTVEITVEQKTSAKGNKYQVAKIVKVLEGAPMAAANAGQSTAIPWATWRTMAGEAHKVASELEPDATESHSDPTNGGEVDTIVVDRSTARASIVNTIMIAYSNGKIAFGEDEDEIPFAWLFIVFFSAVTSGLFI